MIASFWDFFTEDLVIGIAKVIYQITRAAIGYFG